jgi:hypothetical protein
MPKAKSINVDLTESMADELIKIKDNIGVNADSEAIRFLIHQYYLVIKENPDMSLIGLLSTAKANLKERSQ